MGHNTVPVAPSKCILPHFVTWDCEISRHNKLHLQESKCSCQFQVILDIVKNSNLNHYIPEHVGVRSV